MCLDCFVLSLRCFRQSVRPRPSPRAGSNSNCPPPPPPHLHPSCSLALVLERDVRLPGKDASTPEVFPFGTPYRDIFDSLRRKDEDFFLRNNLLPLVARNATIKAAPQRFQEIEGPDMAGFDVVLCFDSRVFYLVVEGISPFNVNTCLFCLENLKKITKAASLF